ncbi:GSU3529 family protein [Desulfuromonas sp. AOP6]|uniref:GSU3529 family protein n=1 Tax=Desulfuromonas sp. AOP6 TaxID=1566351 RepID=UPI00127465D5|nr:hypothetical protein [Desulfuromonas sp. AOP6]BCA79909.1 hypothetical protein AOP6_1696 [Desulfuromonas sp. AOP6]
MASAGDKCYLYFPTDNKVMFLVTKRGRMLDIFNHLQQAVKRAQNENELPDYLAARILRIAEQQDRYQELQAEVERLIHQLADYDTYGQTGYLGMGVNNVILEKTIDRLEGQAAKP